MSPHITNIHASCVALDPQRGVLIRGAAGSGKSSLALGLMAFGAHLVADDRVDLQAQAGALIASAPAPLRHQIEARQVGILHADALEHARVSFIVDLDHEETERLPPHREEMLLDVTLPLVLRVQHDHLVSAVLQYLKMGRVA
ncbi:serine kinase [Thioclava sp. SK-1]|uniref:HPr kinase/phosphorylase n=1 Tax=Thioclava sp. SK-1 TaxID=1889770 RepID=UPI000824B77D|nr:HPr kinase/phosphatase C-terminal domain-containing protein [Thioclava sp. SK-1]OCX58665.1 serine kinase [Thioclava sp. SK-1]